MNEKAAHIQLVKRGVIAKGEDGFMLTTKGARWVNVIGTGNFSPAPLPRTLIQFFAHDTAGNIVLASRHGQLRDLLYEHMLPGDLHPYGLTAMQGAEQVGGKLFGTDGGIELATIAEVIYKHKDGLFIIVLHIFL